VRVADVEDADRHGALPDRGRDVSRCVGPARELLDTRPGDLTPGGEKAPPASSRGTRRPDAYADDARDVRDEGGTPR
jgi:hypothetical protein